jgi:glycosyltransferase involved in cell wall biosynthesis
MKKVVLITHVDFWRQGSGNGARIMALVEFLADNTSLTVLYGGIELPGDAQWFRSAGSHFRFVYLDRSKYLTFEQYAECVKKFMLEHPADVCILEYIEISFLLDVLPKTLPVILDTHDIHSDRNLSFESFNLEAPVFTTSGRHISQSEEIEIFKRYSSVILINHTDYCKVSKLIGYDKTILAPHPPKVSPHRIRKQVKNIGFVASAYTPNVHAIKDFITNVWPAFSKMEVTLGIYGKAGYQLQSETSLIKGNIKVHGFVKEMERIYREIDIVINPVSFGAGLKIKNMEALGNGIPLVTTRHGAIGIEDGIDQCFHVCDDAYGFIDRLHLLMGSFDERKRLAKSSIAYIQSKFTPQHCFAGLLTYINRS